MPTTARPRHLVTLRAVYRRSIHSLTTMATLKRSTTVDTEISPPPTKRKVKASTTSSLVNDFFKPVSQKEPLRTVWAEIDGSLLRCQYEKTTSHAHTTSRRVAAFDLDSTLITTASGKKFGREPHDWKWFHVVIEAKLAQLVKDGYQLVILSNQAGLTLQPDPKKAISDRKKLADWKSKVNTILTALDQPVTLYAATRHDIYRKPRTGMWQRFFADQGLADADGVDYANSFFVGDAGGRTPGPGTQKQDFSCSDRDLAANIGIKFFSPEEFFLEEEARPYLRVFDPRLRVNDLAIAPATDFTKRHPLEIVVHVGSPGAGKSSFYWKHLEPLQYKRVNQDILKTRDRCIAAAREYLDDNQSVVVDNTNADIDVRAHWIRLGQEYKVPVRCVLFTASIRMCEHNNVVRALGGTTVNPESRTILPKMAFTGFASRYREPTLEEGFMDITIVPFVASRSGPAAVSSQPDEVLTASSQFSGDDAQRAIWARYWL